MPGDRPDDYAPGGPDDREVDALERRIDLSIRRADDATRQLNVVRRRPRWLIGYAVLVTIALLGACGVGAYLWYATDEWRSEAEHRQALATDLADQRDELAAELDQAQRDLSATEEQLLELQNRLLTLAEERAQTGDELELTRMIAQDVAGVAADLQSCVQGQDTLIGVLEQPELYDPEAVDQVVEEVRTACNEALQRSEQLQQRLGGE